MIIKMANIYWANTVHKAPYKELSTHFPVSTDGYDSFFFLWRKNRDTEMK